MLKSRRLTDRRLTGERQVAGTFFKRAVITGGSSGIGLAIAAYLAVRGTQVIILARDAERLKHAERYLRIAAGGMEPEEAENVPNITENNADGNMPEGTNSSQVSTNKQASVSSTASAVQTYQLDVTDRKSVDKIADIIISMKNSSKNSSKNSQNTSFSAEKLDENPPDLLINCAGTAYPDYFASIDSENFDLSMQVNLTGTWNVLKAFVPHMKAGSCIVNVSSVAGFVGTFGYTAYSAAKFGVIGLSEALRNEMAVKHITVSVLCPPDTETPQLHRENLTKPAETKAIAGNAGVLKPEDVAKALFKGLKRKKFLIIPGTQGKMIYLLKRFFPRLVYASIDASAKKISRTKL